MNKIIAVISMLLLLSCMETEETILIRYAELSIVVDNVGFDELKSNDLGGVPECNDWSMDYALFTLEFTDEEGNVLSTKEYKTEIFQPNGNIVSQPIKIYINDQPTIYARLTSFIVYHEKANADDVIVKAAPLPGSKYYPLVNNGLGSLFTLDRFTKKELALDVLCYDPLYIVEFGFTWLNLNEVTVRSQCWAGTLCIDDITPFVGSVYEQQPDGVAAQMPAIFKVDVLSYKGAIDGNYDDDRNWDLLITHTHEANAGECLEVFWPDNNERSDLIRFDLFVLLPNDEGTMSYQFQKSYSFYDDQAPDAGTTGIFEFVYGDCSASDYPPVVNGCTLTQGFWKTHTGVNKKTGLPYWGAIDPDSEFFSTGLSYREVFAKKPSESKYYSLAHQFIAAKLNVEVGGVDITVCTEVNEQYPIAQNLLETLDPSDDLVSVWNDLVYAAETLDLFNNGVLCVKHCE